MVPETQLALDLHGGLVIVTAKTAVEDPAGIDPSEPKGERSTQRATGKRAPGRPPAADKAPRPPGRPSNSAKLVDALAEKWAMVFTLAAMGAAGGNPFTLMEPPAGSLTKDMLIMSEAARPICEALVKTSERNKPLRSALEKIAAASENVELLTVILSSVALPIMANHGLLPAGLADAITGSDEPTANAA